MLNSKILIEEQAKKWLKRTEHRIAEPDVDQLNLILSNKKRLDQEEEKYATLYATENLSLEVFKSLTEKIKEKRKLLAYQQSRLPEEKKNTKTDISEEKLLSTLKNMSLNLDFSDKRYIIKQIVNQVIAEKDSVIVKGFLPIDESRLGYGIITRYRRLTKCRQINIVQCFS